MRNSHRTEQRSNNTVLFLPNQKREKKVVIFFLIIQANITDNFVYILSMVILHI